MSGSPTSTGASGGAPADAPGNSAQAASSVAAAGGVDAVPAQVRRPIEHDLLLAALPHPIIVLSEADRIVYANPAAEVFAGVSHVVMKRQTLAEVLAFGCPVLALVEQVRRTGVTVNEYAIDVTVPRVEGSRLADVYAGPLSDRPGHVLIMLQQRSMAQMIERQFTHRAAARSISGMAAVLAHEIKNPLSGIRGAAQLLEPGLDDNDRQLAQLICDETDRIRKLVDRMEVFGDERPLAREPVNVHDVLDHVTRLAQSGFAKGITFHVAYDPSLPSVPGNRDKLVQALLNLVKNAAEAIHEGGEVGRIALQTAFRPGVRLSVPGASARVSLPLMIQIEDNGPGVPDALKPHLFDPFVTTKRQGSGLGLALVAKIVGDHGGIIECESEPGRTVFRLLLPMHDTRSRMLPADAADTHHPASPSTRNKRGPRHG